MAFVVTAGQLQAVQQSYGYRSSAWAHRGYSVTLAPNYTLTYGQLYRAQPALRTVVGFVARNIAQLSVDPYRRLSDTDRVRANDHPLARLLDCPIAGGTWTKYRLLNALVIDLCVYDDAYWVKILGDGGIRGIQPVPARLVTPMGRNMLAPEFYRLAGNRGHLDLAPDRLVHFHGYDPEDSTQGAPPVETLRQILAEEHSASVYRDQMWRNGARMAGYLTRPATAPRWSTDARDRFKGEWQTQYVGDGPATGGTPILEDGMEFKGSGVTPRDAQYVEARKLTREEVAVAYHVPPAMLGLMDGANFSSVTELHRMLYQDTLAPWLVQIAQDIERQLLPDVDKAGAENGTVYVEFDIKGKLAGSFEEQAKSLQSAVGGPWMTRAEARAINNLRHIDGADELIVPLNVVTGGLASPNDTAPDVPDNEASNGKAAADLEHALRRHFARQRDAATAKVGAGVRDADALLPPARWDAELAADIDAWADLLDPPAVNAATRAALAKALAADAPVDAVAAVFADCRERRARDIAHEWETLA